MKMLLTLTLFASLAAHAEVNMKDASYYKNWTDLSRADHRLLLKRNYNSRSLHDGFFGVGWCSEFEKHLDLRDPRKITLHDCRRNDALVFQVLTNKLYRATTPRPESLRRVVGLYILTSPHQPKEYYNEKGDLIALEEVPGFKLTLFYSQGRLAKITAPDGGELQLSWNSHGKVQRVRLGTYFSDYSYLGRNLKEVRIQNKTFVRYRYDEYHNLIQFQMQDGSQENIDYDTEKDWVMAVKDRHHCLQIFKYQKTLSTGEKRCPGKAPVKVTYRFWEKESLPGQRELAKSRFQQGSVSTEKNYLLNIPLKTASQGDAHEEP